MLSKLRIVLKITIPSSACDVHPPLSQAWLRPSSPSSAEFIPTPKLLRWGPLIPTAAAYPSPWLEHRAGPWIPSGMEAGPGSCPSWTQPLGAWRLLWDSWLQPQALPQGLFLALSLVPSSPSLPDPQHAVSEVEFGGFSDFFLIFPQPGNEGRIQAEPAPCPGGSRDTMVTSPHPGRFGTPSLPLAVPGAFGTLSQPSFPGNGTDFQGKFGTCCGSIRIPLGTETCDPPVGPSRPVPKASTTPGPLWKLQDPSGSHSWW